MRSKFGSFFGSYDEKSTFFDWKLFHCLDFRNYVLWQFDNFINHFSICMGQVDKDGCRGLLIRFVVVFLLFEIRFKSYFK